MKKMLQILSTLMLVMICCVSVFQYHHHDNSGHAFFMTYGDKEIAMTGHCHAENCQQHECGETHGNGEEMCGMHLDAAMEIGKTDIQAVEMEQIACWIADCVMAVPTPNSDVEMIIPNRKPGGLAAIKYSHSKSSRGSPATV